ncbi:MFS transporter [Phormidium yuhuli AB48]|uniref:MFS transporter n=1 Tax=Phormidium yuhuli AB48 TaxID=2940671 RepID=A0ABY5AR33_9CYAN|nr:MFS transporter [Phormidium yuhuli]USR91680.1 MFS transporter [Phormidium yuhuli AB48]
MIKTSARQQVRILILGRFLSQIGTGFTLFYAPIFFVNQVGISTTLVGIALGAASIAGIIGRVLSGSLCDSPRFGRKRTLLLSAVSSGLGSFLLATTQDFSTLLIGSLLNGFGLGLYWPAAETIVADLTQPEERRETYALNRLADSLGLEFGIVLGGAWVEWTQEYRLLFIIDGVSYVVFFLVLGLALKETIAPGLERENPLKNWLRALSDRTLLIYAAANILFTTYISQNHTALPVYLSNFIPGAEGNGFPARIVSGLFAWHIAVSVLLQLPMARWLNRFNHARALMISACIWALSFISVWVIGNSSRPLIWSIVALGVMAIATISYTPSASALVVELAPEQMRGVYLSINSLCWAIGYAIGPPLGGIALDGSQQLANNFWLLLAGSLILIIWILQRLEQRLIAQGQLYTYPIPDESHL